MNDRLFELTRRWWSGDLGRAGKLLHGALAPAEAAYRAGVALRDQAYGRDLLEVRRATVPVISVGNVAVGGTGKTPFAHWVAVTLRDRGRRPAILHGGYADDEPELHRQWSPDIPVVAEKDRFAGAERAVDGGADALVLDDGFQHRRLHRDLDIVLISAERWDDDAHLLPRGPWREPRKALRRADLVVVTRKAAPGDAALAVANAVRALSRRLPVATAHLRPAGWRAPNSGTGAVPPPPGPALLVSGLAEPGLFAASAIQAGAEVGGELVFADHHAYVEGDVARIRASAAGRPIVTTEKDWTKLRHWLGNERVWVLVQDVVIESGRDTVLELIERTLS
jgi:tetraacyldisaccharide 4'-kinase